MDRLLLGQVCDGQIVTGEGLWSADFYWGRFVLDRLLLGQVCDGQIVTGAGL